MARGRVRAIFVLPPIAVALALAIVATGEAGANDARVRVRDAELTSLENEAEQAAISIALRFDEIRALWQATGPARVGLTNDELLRVIEARDITRLLDHLVTVHRAMPPEVQVLSVTGGDRDAQGIWQWGAATTTRNTSAVVTSGQGVVRGPPGVALYRPAVFSQALDPADLPLPEITAPYAMYSWVHQIVFLGAPILGPDGRQRGEIGADVRIGDLLSRMSLPPAAPGKDMYIVDAKGRLIRQLSREVPPSGRDLATSDAVRRILADEVVREEARLPLVEGPQLVTHARTPVLRGALPAHQFDVGWHVIVFRSADAVYANIDASLAQLRLVRLVLAALLMLGAVVIGVVLDTTIRQRRELHERSLQLETATRNKSEFLGNMSHELRTPLNAIIGFSDVIRMEMAGPINAKQREYVDDILGAGRHLLALINEILDLSKVEAGRMELDLATFELATALEEAADLVRERARTNLISLEVSLAPDLGPIEADERKIKQIILNLLSNAIKFTPHGGRVELRARRSDGEVEVSVRDTGVGIAPEDQQRVFEEFRQVGDGPRREGTGLGLTLTKRFVELHGGRIALESDPGSGSTFTFRMPARRRS